MLKRMFALSNQGLRDLNKGIAATTLSNLCLIAPVSLLVMVIWELLNVISGQESSMRDHAALFICGTVVMFIIVFLTQWLQYNKTYTVAYKESANRRIVLAEKLRKLPLSFFGQRDLSDLTTTIMGDCTALERVFSNAIPQLFGTIFMFIITAIGLLVLDWRMGLCIVVPVPVAALVVFAAKKAQSNAESANMDAKRAAYDGVQEYLDTIQELKSCSREEEYLEGLEKKLDYVVKCSFRNEIAPGAATTTAQFILRFGLVAVMLVGGILVTTGSLSIPMFILFLLFAGRIYDPFTSCFMLMAEVFSALVSVKRMKQIDATPEQTGTNVCNNKGYDIEFKNVVFSYNEEPVLKGVSFVAKQGEVTALVGPSGSGKSTASKLAARFWDADSGTITLGGVDVKTVEPETLFKNYAIVFQDVMLFDETVMENIRLGRGDATDEEVMNMRYLRISGVLQRKGRGLIIVPAKHVMAEKLAKSTASAEPIMEQYKLLCNGAPLPTDNVEVAKSLLDDLIKQMKERHIAFDISDLPLTTSAEINIARQRLENILAQTDEIQYAIPQDDVFVELKKPILAVTQKVDLLVIDDQIVTNDIGLLQTHYDFQRYVRTTATHIVSEITTLDFVSNMDKVTEYISRSRLTYLHSGKEG